MRGNQPGLECVTAADWLSDRRERILRLAGRGRAVADSPRTLSEPRPSSAPAVGAPPVVATATAASTRAERVEVAESAVEEPLAGAIKWLYVLRLQDGCFYVGVTYDLSRRLAEHMGRGRGQSGRGAAWTTVHPMIELLSARPVEADDPVAETAETLRLMLEHGPDRVRGGTMCSISLHAHERAFVHDLRCAQLRICRLCGAQLSRSAPCPCTRRPVDAWSDEPAPAYIPASLPPSPRITSVSAPAPQPVPQTASVFAHAPRPGSAVAWPVVESAKAGSERALAADRSRWGPPCPRCARSNHGRERCKANTHLAGQGLGLICHHCAKIDHTNKECFETTHFDGRTLPPSPARLTAGLGPGRYARPL